MTEFDHIYRRTRKRLIVGSFIISLLLDFIPVPAPVLYWMPEFTALLLVFWALHRPQNIGISIAFMLGLLLDIGTGAPLGQHALAFVIGIYVLQHRQRQIMLYAFGLQSLAVLGVLLLIQAVVLVVYFFNEHVFAGWGLLISPFISALLWPLLNNLMLALANVRRRT